MKRLTLAIAGGLLAAAPGAAHGDTGGGISATPPPGVSSIACRTDCVDARTARPGSLVRVKGWSMRGAKAVTFVGRRGSRDDVTVPVAKATPRSVIVRVPANAVPGRLRVRGADGALSRPSSVTIRLSSGAASAEDGPEPLAPKVADRDTTDRIDAHVDTNTVFYDGFRKATLRYVVTGPEPVELAIELVRAADGAALQRWTPGAVAPGAEQRVDWDGTAGGKVVPEGRYAFRVTPLSANAAEAPGGEPPLVVDSFRFLDHKFPVRGKHSYGEEIARFGAGRSGHSHQGQDVFAKCGTPLVAARGGVVRWQAFQSRAGNYVVIDGDGTDVDYAYMHLQAPSTLKKGDHVVTGQRIGNVGDTGAASGCHLHFELWTGPGWYEGGKPFDPLESLLAWDRQSGAVQRR